MSKPSIFNLFVPACGWRLIKRSSGCEQSFPLVSPGLSRELRISVSQGEGMQEWCVRANVSAMAFTVKFYMEFPFNSSKSVGQIKEMNLTL